MSDALEKVGKTTIQPKKSRGHPNGVSRKQVLNQGKDDQEKREAKKKTKGKKTAKQELTGMDQKKKKNEGHEKIDIC